jgi:hypothetical protein
LSNISTWLTLRNLIKTRYGRNIMTKYTFHITRQLYDENVHTYSYTDVADNAETLGVSDIHFLASQQY